MDEPRTTPPILTLSGPWSAEVTQIGKHYWRIVVSNGLIVMGSDVGVTGHYVRGGRERAERKAVRLVARAERRHWTGERFTVDDRAQAEECQDENCVGLPAHSSEGHLLANG